MEAAQLVAQNAVDVFSVYVHESGGVLKASRNLGGRASVWWPTPQT
jgi:hypothetical protein